MNGFIVDPKKCKRDGICAAECPAGVIKKVSPEDYPEPTADFEKFCLSCGHCVAVCPHQALSLPWLTPEICHPIKPELTLTIGQAEQFLRLRRSIRNFRDKPVNRDKLNKLLEIATYAPSAKNMQPWHWVVIQESSEVKRLAGLVIDWMRAVIKEKPELARQKAFDRAVAAWKRGKDPVCRGASHLIVVHADKNWAFGSEDCSCALTFIDLFAPLLGLGTCWAGYFYTAANAYQPLFEALGVHPDHRVFGAMMVGYPKFTYHRLPLRNPPRVTWK